jgi:uncharacterized protein (TIGR02246 family)
MLKGGNMLARRTALLALSAGLLVSRTTFAATLDEEVRQAYAAWDAAFAKADAKAIGAFYTDDALLLPPTHDVLKGPAGVEKFFAGLFAAGVTGHKLDLIEANGTSDMIVASAKWSARSKEGEAGGLAMHEFTRQQNRLKLRLHTFN